MEIQSLSPETIQDITPSIPNDSIPIDQISSTFTSNYTDLISRPLGSTILSTSDEFFAPATNLLSPHPPLHRPGVYIATGAWYDGWETRRHNPAAYDWVVIKLGVAAGRARGVEIDTAFFDGNHAEAVAVDGCFEQGEGADVRVAAGEYARWREVLGKRACGPSRRHAWWIPPEEPNGEDYDVMTHVRLRMFPDGGIARFRLYGEAIPSLMVAGGEVELSAAGMGGVAVGCSNERWGRAGNLLLPGRGEDMGDGWETRRSRGAGHEDWVVVRLGFRGCVGRIVVDTRHFRGNYPRAFKVHGADFGEGEGWKGKGEDRWVEILGEKVLGPDTEFDFGEGELGNVVGRAYTHIKMTIIPDGGVKRFRVFGTVAERSC